MKATTKCIAAAALALTVMGAGIGVWASPHEAHAESVAAEASSEVCISLGELVSHENGLDTYAIAGWEEDGDAVEPVPDVTVSIATQDDGSR
ncbi:hypothetical protein [uncultured Enorma sp.]|uniref:hypothetical protein n=1 Tax=uncultured Enorma sp. TaxID=1714346 RepID=UPI0026DDA694|nr:hypothetical protein [uncultured Enorma sp.]